MRRLSLSVGLCHFYGDFGERSRHGLNRLLTGGDCSRQAEWRAHFEARGQAAAIVENYESGSSISEISENFTIYEITIQQVLAFACQWKQADL